MKFVKRSEIERMANNVIDELTGMTELDYYEWCHPYEDITIIEDTYEPRHAKKDDVWGDDDPKELDNLLNEINNFCVIDVEFVVIKSRKRYFWEVK